MSIQHHAATYPAQSSSKGLVHPSKFARNLQLLAKNPEIHIRVSHRRGYIIGSVEWGAGKTFYVSCPGVSFRFTADEIQQFRGNKDYPKKGETFIATITLKKGGFAS